MPESAGNDADDVYLKGLSLRHVAQSDRIRSMNNLAEKQL